MNVRDEEKDLEQKQENIQKIQKETETFQEKGLALKFEDKRRIGSEPGGRKTHNPNKKTQNNKMTRVFPNSPPERPGGADDIITDRRRPRKPLLLVLLPPDSTHPIGRQQQQPRPQLGGGAADPRSDPAADHTPG